MTLKEVRARVSEITSMFSRDEEKAHGMEDSLFKDVLGAIAKGKTKQPRALAREALKSAELVFPRWGA